MGFIPNFDVAEGESIPAEGFLSTVNEIEGHQILFVGARKKEVVPSEKVFLEKKIFNNAWRSQ